MSEKPHPKQIGGTYAAQIITPEDSIREAENEERKAGLEQIQAEGAKEHEGMAAFHEASELALSEYVSTEETRPDDEQSVNAAILDVVQAADARVTNAAMTSDERLAQTIAKAIKAQGDPASPATYADAAERAALEAELADEDLAQLDAEAEWEDAGHGY